MPTMASTCLAILPWIAITCAFQIQTPATLFSKRAVSSPFSTTLRHQSVTNVVDITAPRDIGPLSEWSNNWGIQTSDCFQLVSEDGVDVYAISNQNIPAESPILAIPSDIILTGNKAREEFVGYAYNAEQMLLTSADASDRVPQFYLFLKVLKEYEMGMDSAWYTWLNSLPRYHSNGASMTDFCFGCLPPYAAEVSLVEKRCLRQFVQSLSEIPFLSDRTKQNEVLTTWAFSIVHTRYFTVPNNGDVCIVPMADFFNHGGVEEEEVNISYDDNGNCFAYSNYDITAGQPLRICYGDPTNPSNLLARYGFLDESSPATFCKYVIPNPSQEVLELGYDPSRMLFYNDGGISQEVWDVLLYQELAQVSSDLAQDFYNAHIMGDVSTKQQYQEQYFPQALAALKNHVDFLVNELEELSIGLETQVDQGLDGWRHPRLGLILRHNEYVKRTFDLVQSNLDNMSF